MLELVDGPCKGAYMCKRAPDYLRAVIDANGDIDCLDQIEDTPKSTESVYVYKRIGLAGTIHIHATKGSGWYAMGTYNFLHDVDGEKLRDNQAWQIWAIAQLRRANGNSQ